MKQKILFINLLFFAFEGKTQNSQIALADEYFSQNELNKAISIYEKLIKVDSNLFIVHSNYFNALIKTQSYKTCGKYLKKIVRRFPLEPSFNIDYGHLLTLQGDTLKAYQQYDKYLYSIRNNGELLKNSARKLISLGLYDKAEKSFRYGNYHDDDFDYDIAELYFKWGKIDEMLKQYLFIVSKNAQQIPKVQGLIQDNLSDKKDFDKLKPIIFDQIRTHPNKLYLNEMLIWYLLQKKEFYQAFIQSKAVDKRKNEGGTRIFTIGQLALGNKKYKIAVKIFKYLTDRYSTFDVYIKARKYLIKAKEEQVKNTYPIDVTSIRSLVQDYQDLIDERGINGITADVIRSMALLQGFYLDRKDTAIIILEALIQRRSMYRQLISEAKIDLGDIYLLKGEPWEATLLYSQVEKAEKNKNMGYLAKLKNAKLSYYKGDFELAKAHLDILKLATSREIANDAMALSLKIQDNLELDTTATAMEQYAEIELLIFQNKYKDALHAYNNMLSKYKDHSLVDDILWDKANLLIKLGKYQEAIVSLEVIIFKYSDSIWADDAVFFMGVLYEENLKDKEMAKECFQKQLVEYQGSVHNVEARKRFRKLRGDKIN